jgi:hypothetical protein
VLWCLESRGFGVVPSAILIRERREERRGVRSSCEGSPASRDARSLEDGRKNPLGLFVLEYLLEVVGDGVVDVSTEFPKLDVSRRGCSSSPCLEAGMARIKAESRRRLVILHRSYCIGARGLLHERLNRGVSWAYKCGKKDRTRVSSKCVSESAMR